MSKMKMKAAVFVERGTGEADPDVGLDALMRVTTTTICALTFTS
jgi:hypothetical protein